jgi:hypothetical protein
MVSNFVKLFAIVTMTDSIEAVDLRNWALNYWSS